MLGVLVWVIDALTGVEGVGSVVDNVMVDELEMTWFGDAVLQKVILVDRQGSCEIAKVVASNSPVIPVPRNTKRASTSGEVIDTGSLVHAS